MSTEHRPSLQTGRTHDEDGTGLRVGLVCGRFNDVVTDELLAGCRARLTALGVADDDVEVHWAPGAFEIPLVARELAASGRVDAVVTFGAVIRGDTPHFEYVAGACAAGVARAALDTGVPVIFGVLTTDTVGQAMVRARPDRADKGAEAADAAVETACVLRRIRAGGAEGDR